MNIHVGLFGFGIFELPNPDARQPRRRSHDTLVDHRPLPSHARGPRTGSRAR
jgi:hypothetical protein